MLDKLPRQYRGDPTVKTLADAICGVLAALETEAASVPPQISLDAVTWNLETEERLVGITPAPGATPEERRTALKSKWRAGGKLTIEQVQAVCDAWKNGEVVVGFTGGKIRIQFVGAYGVPVDLDALKAAVRLVIPAHLAAEYIIKYLLIRDIHEVKTLAQMDQIKLDQFAGGNSYGQ